MSLPIDLPVLYCDEALLVVNKPTGLATLPDGYDPSLPHVKNMLEQVYGRLWIVHRLDKGTSGVLILARTSTAHRSLNTQFEQHTVIKIYHSLVIGNPAWHEKTISLPLKPNGDRQHRTVVDLRAGKRALTHLSVVERFGQVTLLQAIPATGRTHQIRAHLSAIGLYIIGDKLYGMRQASEAELATSQRKIVDDSCAAYPGAMALHAHSLEINHPVTLERMKFTAPCTPAMGELLHSLRASSLTHTETVYKESHKGNI